MSRLRLILTVLIFACGRSGPLVGGDVRDASNPDVAVKDMSVNSPSDMDRQRDMMRRVRDLAFGFDLGSPPDLAMPADLATLPDLANSDMAISSAPCLTGGSVIYFDGDRNDWIHPGVETIQVSTWSPIGTEQDTFWYQTQDDLGRYWSFAFSAMQLNQPLAVGRYDNATRHPFEAPGVPGIDVTGRGHGCNTSTGWFEIESIAGGPNNGTFTELTATFEQYCDSTTAALRGCIHFEN